MKIEYARQEQLRLRRHQRHACLQAGVTVAASAADARASAPCAITVARFGAWRCRGGSPRARRAGIAGRLAPRLAARRGRDGFRAGVRDRGAGHPRAGGFALAPAGRPASLGRACLDGRIAGGRGRCSGPDRRSRSIWARSCCSGSPRRAGPRRAPCAGFRSAGPAWSTSGMPFAVPSIRRSRPPAAAADAAPALSHEFPGRRRPAGRAGQAGRRQGLRDAGREVSARGSSG